MQRRHPRCVLKRTSASVGADTNISPSPNFITTCQPTDDSINCITEEIEAVDNAQAQEGLQPIGHQHRRAHRCNSAPLDQMFVLTDPRSE